LIALAYLYVGNFLLNCKTFALEERVPIKAAQERLGHSRPDILLKFYAHVLDASADAAAESLSGHLSGRFSVAKTALGVDL
jgi:hypothetical protein